MARSKTPHYLTQLPTKASSITKPNAVKKPSPRADCAAMQRRALNWEIAPPGDSCAKGRRKQVNLAIQGKEKKTLTVQVSWEPRDCVRREWGLHDWVTRTTQVGHTEMEKCLSTFPWKHGHLPLLLPPWDPCLAMSGVNAAMAAAKDASVSILMN